jgi:hypothetical protein
VQAALVIVQLPGTLAHGTCELQAACVFAQVPIDEQSLEPRHSTVASLAQVPRTSGQFPGSELQTAPPLLQVPFVRHIRLAFACVVPLHGCCDQGWPFCFEQVPGVVGQFAADPQAAPPCAQVPPATTGQLALLVQDFNVHAPLRGQFALLEHTVTASGQVFWLQDPLIVVHCALDTHVSPAGLLH